MGPCWSLHGPSCPLSPGTLVPGGQGWGRKQGGWLLCGAESSWLSSGARQTSQNSVSLGNPRSFPNQRIGKPMVPSAPTLCLCTPCPGPGVRQLWGLCVWPALWPDGWNLLFIHCVALGRPPNLSEPYWYPMSVTGAKMLSV